MKEIKEGFARYVSEYVRSLAATTPAMVEYLKRDMSAAVLFVPARMIDSANEMLASYRRMTPEDSVPGNSAKLPVILVAMGKDYSPVRGDISRQLPHPVWVTLPQDDQGRVFKMRQSQGDRRAQLLFVASDEPTARSLANQFCLWISGARRFYSNYQFAGFEHHWPVMIENPDTMVSNAGGEEKNLTMLVADINLIETIPIFQAANAAATTGELGDSDTAAQGFATVQHVVVHDQVMRGGSRVDNVGTPGSPATFTTYFDGDPPVDL